MSQEVLSLEKEKPGKRFLRCQPPSIGEQLPARVVMPMAAKSLVLPNSARLVRQEDLGEPLLVAAPSQWEGFSSGFPLKTLGTSPSSFIHGRRRPFLHACH
jgi:hypothetical protein